MAQFPSKLQEYNATFLDLKGKLQAAKLTQVVVQAEGLDSK